jgi:hypothetical protein
VLAEIPGAVHTRYGDVNGIFKPLRYPVHGEGDEYKESYHFACTAPTCTSITGWIISRLVLNVDSDKCDRIPCAKRGSKEATNETDQINMTVLFGDINARLQHQDGKWYPRYPRDEAYDGKYAKKEEDYAARPIFPRKHIYSGCECENNVENTSYPNELLGEYSREPYIRIANNNRDTKAEGEEDDGIGSESKIIGAVINASTIESFSMCITLKRQA